MRRIRYRDAVRLLGGGDERVVRLLDYAATGAILTGALVTNGAALAFLDVKSELIKVGNDALRFLVERKLKVTSRSNIDSLIAAHSVLVITAFLEALLELPAPPRRWLRMNYNRAGENELPYETHLASEVYTDIQDAAYGRLSSILEGDIPCPDSTIPFTALVQAIRNVYRQLVSDLIEYIEDSQYFEALTESDQFIARRVVGELSGKASIRYVRSFYALAVDCPIFFIWASLNEEHSTHALTEQIAKETRDRLERLRTDISDMNSSMMGLQRLLGATHVGSQEYARSAASIRGRAELDWPIVDAGPLNVSSLIQFPRLVDGYINPAGRITVFSEQSSIADDRWWEGQRHDSISWSQSPDQQERNGTDVHEALTTIALKADIQTTIASLLVGPGCADRPIVVLGQPGAGKSVLTRVLAARLMEAGLLAVRVELRRVEPDAPIQAQIEESVYLTTGERTTWPDMIRAVPDAPRVVMLDGFDELLQATGVNQSDYLEKVREFQVREQELGRTVAVLVTSRTVVADRVRCPIGSTIIRLEPFTEVQVRRWANVWNATNARYYSGSRLPFSASSAMTGHPELVSQPLLLLMLALYDAEAGDLSKTASAFARGDLYEQILIRFVRREVLRGNPKQDVASTDIAVERELTRLSAVAFAMFNRNRQSVIERDLEADLRALKVPQYADSESISDHDSASPFAGPVSFARRLLGRFFFVFDSTARLNGANVSAYEFLHATFGEYLIARLAVRTSLDLVERIAMANEAARIVPTGDADDGLLFGLLSFTPFTARAAALEFLREQLDAIATQQRVRLRATLAKLLTATSDAMPPRSFADYRPSPADSILRQATYLANLLLMILASSREPFEMSEIFIQAIDANDMFTRLAHLCRSQMSPEAWRGFADSLVIARDESNSDARTIRLSDGVSPRTAFIVGGPLLLDVLPAKLADAIHDLWIFDEIGAIDDLRSVSVDTKSA